MATLGGLENPVLTPQDLGVATLGGLENPVPTPQDLGVATLGAGLSL